MDFKYFFYGIIIGCFVTVFIDVIIKIISKKHARKSGVLIVKYDNIDDEYYVFSKFSEPISELVKHDKITMAIDFSHE